MMKMHENNTNCMDDNKYCMDDNEFIKIIRIVWMIKIKSIKIQENNNNEK